MKNILKFLLSFICYTLLIPILVLLTVSLTWYILPDFKNTFIGEYILSIVSENELLVLSIALIVFAIVVGLFGRLFRVVHNSKVVNFYTHLVTWLLAICICIESIFTFFVSDTLTATEFKLNIVRKIALGAGVLLMLLYTILHKKLSKIVDRKLQAYDTAKELNMNGRSSVVWVNILKTIDFIFPEFLLLLMLCFSFSMEVSLYFIIILCSFLIPIIGNMVCDKRVRKEAIRKDIEKQEAQVNATAEAVADLLRLNGGNI